MREPFCVAHHAHWCSSVSYRVWSLLSSPGKTAFLLIISDDNSLRLAVCIVQDLRSRGGLFLTK